MPAKIAAANAESTALQELNPHSAKIEAGRVPQKHGTVRGSSDGHNYKVRVTLAGAELDAAGLLLDFKLLKQVMRPVIDRIDHQMLNELEPFTVINPSAENIARFFYDETNQQLAEMTSGRVRVKDCTIWETDTTTATYYE